MNCQLNNPKHAESFPPENTCTAWQTAKEELAGSPAEIIREEFHMKQV
ncbi:TPA: hypothetical protein ACUKFN_003434 [Escherichia coli]